MAFADLGSLGATGSSGNNQSTLVLTLGATGVAIGELVVVVVADDNIGTGADADGGEVSSVADSGGNTWFKAKGWTLTTGGAQNGAAVSLWWTTAKFAIAATTGTITATFANATLSDATALTARHFSVAGRVAIAATNQSTQTAGTDPSSLDAVTPNIACLRIRGFACEVGNNTNLTPTSNWTAWANGNSATSGTILEMVARAEHHISTGTGDASDPTYAVTADYAHVYVAFKELPPQTFDWTNPSLGRVREGANEALRAQGEVWVDTNPNLLKGQDRVYGGPGQVADYDWSNPQNRLAASAHIALRAEGENTGVNLALFVPPVSVTYQPRSPLFLERWAPPHSISLRTWIGQPPPTEGGPPPDTTNTTRSPVFLRGWPAPSSISLLTWTDQTKRQLIGQDVFFDGAGRSPVYDYPNPRGAAYPTELRTFINVLSLGRLVPIGRSTDWAAPRAASTTPVHAGSRPLNLNLQIVQAPFNQLDWPTPTITWRLQIDPVPVALSGFDTFYGAQGQVPTHKFPNPRGPVFPTSLLSWIGKFDPTAVVVVQSPFFQTDWLNPCAYVHGRSLLTWTQSLAANLKPPFAKIDWPNPRQKPVTDLTWTQSRFERPDSFYGLAGAINFDWPNPRGPRYPITLRGFIGPITQPPAEPAVEYTFRAPVVAFSWPQTRPSFDPLNLLTNTLGGPVAPPFRPLDWPNPQRHGPRTAPLHFRPKPGEDVVVVTPPIIPTIWPNPGRVSGALWAQIQPQRVAFEGFDTFFGEPGQVRPFDWPNPRGPQHPVSLRTHIDQLRVQTYVVQVPPHACYDWPNPLSPRYSISLRTHIAQFPVLTYVTPVLPPPTYDWPNPPRGPAYPIVLRGFVQGQNRSLIDNFIFYQVRAPVVSFSWPQMFRPVHPPQNLLMTTLGGPVAPPFRPLGWPNPRGALFSIGLRTHVDLLKVLTYVPPPQVQSYVLPNPLGPLFPVSLRSHLVPLNLLAGKDRFFGLAGHPNFNWPNPVLPGIFRQEGTIGENRPLYGGGAAPGHADEWIIRARRRGRR